MEGVAQMVDPKKRKIVIALMVAMFLAAIEGTVVTTAIPTIAKELKGLELISWIFSLYLLTSAISTPIYGKLSDLYGRKNILSIGIVIFIIGSSLCGLSANMYQLIAFRAVQGLGAGAIFTQEGLVGNSQYIYNVVNIAASLIQHEHPHDGPSQ